MYRLEEILSRFVESSYERKKQGVLCPVLRFHQTAAAIKCPEFWLFNLAGWIAGNVCKNDLMGAFVAGQFFTELINILLGTGKALFYRDDGGRNFPQTLIRKSDDSHILNRFIGAQEIFNLNRIQIFPATDNHVFLAVYQHNKSIFVFLGHIAGIQPSVF